MSASRIAPALSLTLAAALPAHAQQFTFQGSLPGGSEWTEGVEAADVDGDGDQDLFLSQGEGIASPGIKLPVGLLINRLEISAGNFADESFARLGPVVGHGKMVNTADVDGDGWVDALFSNAFNTDPPFLFINRGPTQPGFFDEEGAIRGLTTPFSCAGSAIGDVDNDGDLDLVIGDTGPTFASLPGGSPHLYLNDGTGSFTQADSQLNAPTKIGHLDVDLADVDLDWDLDVLVTNRGVNPGGTHTLLLNDGSGTFTNASSLIPDTSSSVYESDFADLDGDQDLDLFFLSLDGFSDGPMRNDLIESGSLGYTAGLPLGGDDDNEVVFIDYDMDDDLDVIIGSLGPSEKIIRNDGGGTFVQTTAPITTISDRTLDVAVVDLDNDADYDLVTVQGESDPANWDNKVFANNGPVDDRPPTIVRTEPLVGVTAAGPWVVRAQVSDQVHDDGLTWVTGEVAWRVDQGAVQGVSQSAPALRSAGSIYRFEMTDTAAGAGSRLVYELNFTDVVGNSSSTGELVVPLLPCGFSAYGTGTPAHTLALAGSNPGTIGSSIDLVTQGVPGDLVFTGLALAPSSLPFAGGTLLLDLGSLVTVAPLAAAGGSAVWTLALPDDTAFVGLPFFFQSIAVDGAQPGGFAFSGGVQLTPCE